MFSALIHGISTVLSDQLPACRVLKKVHTVLAKNIQQFSTWTSFMTEKLSLKLHYEDA